jgi:hypothetical protein
MFKNKDQKLTKVKVAEVTHSIFYAPQYIAHSLGYFEEEGLDVELMLVPGADKVAAAVLSGDVNIGFCGSEASIFFSNVICKYSSSSPSVIVLSFKPRALSKSLSFIFYSQ